MLSLSVLKSFLQSAQICLLCQLLSWEVRNEDYKGDRRIGRPKGLLNEGVILCLGKVSMYLYRHKN